LLGLSVILTMFSLMLERVKTEGQFMLIMVYPLIVPFLILSHNSLIEINHAHFSVFINSFSLQVLIAFDILLLAICPILFSYSVRR
jgi:ABC-type transport system involved in cytochrome c biogenesis permease component